MGKEYFWARAYSKDSEGDVEMDKEERFNSIEEAKAQTEKWDKEDRVGLYNGFSVDIGDSEGEPLEPKEKST